MLEFNELDEYFMKPTKMVNGLLIYPIKIKDYDKFRNICSDTILFDIKDLNNLKHSDFEKKKKERLIDRKTKYEPIQEDNLYDYLINKINTSLIFNNKINKLKSINNEGKEQLKEMYLANNDIESLNILENLNKINTDKSFLDIMIELINMCTKSTIDFSKNIFTIIQNNNSYIIDENNFYEFREIVMNKNLIFTSPTSPSFFGMQAIERAIKSEFGNSETSLASICSVVSCNSGVSDKELENYSYYRLRYDFEIINRQHGNIFSFILRGQGCDKATINNLSEKINLNENPYNNLLSKHKYSTKL